MPGDSRKKEQGCPQVGERAPRARPVCRGQPRANVPACALGASSGVRVFVQISKDLSRCVVQVGLQEMSAVENTYSDELWDDNNNKNYQILSSHHEPSSVLST